MKKILFLSTGGTIASSPSAQGIVPSYSADELLDAFPLIGKMCWVDAKSIMNIDSTNMQPEDWLTIAKHTYEGLSTHDGVVIGHGTHTLAYTASALSFMLQDLRKPVILTGSQIALSEEGTDAGRNLLDAFITACGNLSGVYVVFNRMIIRGTRTSKVKSKSPDAFHSINYPYIGRVFNNSVEYLYRSSIPTSGGLKLVTRICSLVFLLKLIPGTPAELFDALMGIGYKGIIIESYGVGGVPTLGRNLVPKIREMLDRRVCVAIATQSLYNGTDLSINATGRTVLELGVIPGHDMTTEALVTKMMWALGQTDDPEEVRRIMLTNYADELTI